MIGVAGQVATIVGAGLAAYGAFAAIRAYRGRSSALEIVRACWAVFVALAVANALMVAGLVTDDFSVSYVAQVGSRETPLLFKVASLWSALEGSILFWAGLLAAVTVVVARRTPAWDRARLPVTLAVLLALTAFFAGVVAGPASPWGRVFPIPVDGPGPNPLLQDHPLMALHPPLLYLGFVGLAVPFAFTIDALIGGRLDERWLQLARNWTLGPWALLTLGLIAGAWWSYAVLGWGGYWAWDPVENVALLPWLTATAFLHSAMVGRRTGELATWNILLIAASFALTIFATLITRSGVLDSVHAFTRSAIGYLFVGLLGAIVAGTVGLLVLRLPAVRAGSGLGPRGAAFLLNNLLFAAIAAAVFFGTIVPLLVEALTAERVSVGAPYFERIVGPLAVGLLVLTGVGPALPWSRWSARASRSLLSGAAVALGVAALLALQAARIEAIAGSAAAAFALAQSVAFVMARVGRTRAGVRDGSFGSAAARRAIAAGGLVSHIGVAILALAVIGSTTGRREAVLVLRPGESGTALEQMLTASGTAERDGPNRRVIEAQIRTAGGDVLRPALNLFRSSSQAIATPAIVPGVVQDLYLTLLNVDPATGEVTVRVGIHPFVSWIWPAGGLVAVGGLLAAWPLARRRRVERAETAELRARRALLDAG